MYVNILNLNQYCYCQQSNLYQFTIKGNHYQNLWLDISYLSLSFLLISLLRLLLRMIFLINLQTNGMFSLSLKSGSIFLDLSLTERYYLICSLIKLIKVESYRYIEPDLVSHSHSLLLNYELL